MSRSLICETVTGATMAEVVEARDAVAGAGLADMVELRLDGVADADPVRALHGRRLPAVVTCRPVWEGGRFDGAESDRRRLLAVALAQGADYVDVELRAGFDDLLRDYGARVVLSSHDFEGGAAQADERARALRAARPALIKLAVAARRLSDALPLIGVARQGDAVVVAMGETGLPSRLLASRVGSRWTYAGHAVAPGQIPVSRMVHEFRFRTVGPSTAIYGVVGPQAARSGAPRIVNTAFAAAGIDAVCVPLCAADAADLQAFTRAFEVVDLVEDGLPAAELERHAERWTASRRSRTSSCA